MKHIAIYSRKSITTDTGDSIENQISAVKKYFATDECEFTLFEDEGWSGGNDKRPDYQRMMSKIKNNEFDIVAVYMLDRISRNVVDFINFYDTLKKHNVEFTSVTENFDSSNMMGKMYMYLLSIFAEMERENISKRVKDNKLFLTKQGQWCGGKPPTGYTLTKECINDKKITYLKLDDTKKTLIIDIYNKYLELGSLHKIQKWLLLEHNIKYSLSTVKYILSSPVYCIADDDSFKYLSNQYTIYGKPDGYSGYITYDNRKNSSSKREWKSKDMFISVSKHKAIITSSLWIQIQELQKQRAKEPRPKASKISYLTNVLKCDVCGSPMTLNYNHTNKDGIRNYYYICTGKRAYGTSYCSNKWINQKECDQRLIEFLELFTSDKDTFKKMSNKKIEDNPLDKDIKKLEKEINKQNNILKELTKKIIVLHGPALDLVTNEMNSIGDNITELKEKLNSLERKAINQKNSSISIDVMYSEIKKLPTILKDDTIDIEKKRDLVNMFLTEVRWNSNTQSLDVSINI
ncbi:recombinase family protein [Clostridium butyricum]|uniref:recombinase family protein n=1 Tax=Clostridium butyricum TaxID=1492 RepID=UPI002AB186B8|nr:recombinase family protein [Clostridium butyricum]